MIRGKTFVVSFRKGNSPSEQKILNGRGEKKDFLRSLGKGVKVLKRYRLRDPIQLNALRRTKV